MFRLMSQRILAALKSIYRKVRMEIAQYEHMAAYVVDVNAECVLPWSATFSHHKILYRILNNFVSNSVHEYTVTKASYTTGDGVRRKQLCSFRQRGLLWISSPSIYRKTFLLITRMLVH